MNWYSWWMKMDVFFVERVQIIPPDQAWFWSERWQRLEREVQQDIVNHKTHQFDTVDDALNFLKQAAGEEGAENNSY